MIVKRYHSVMFFLQNKLFLPLILSCGLSQTISHAANELSTILNAPLSSSEKIDKLNTLVNNVPLHSVDWKLALYNRAILNYNLKHISLARNDLEEILKIFPDDTDSLYNLCIVLTDFGLFKEAQVRIQQYIEKRPDHHIGYFLMGTLHTYKNEFEAAIKHFDKALFYHPYHLDSMVNRGWAHFHAKNYEQSFRDFENTLKLNSQDVSAKAGKSEILKLLNTSKNPKS